MRAEVETVGHVQRSRIDRLPNWITSFSRNQLQPRCRLRFYRAGVYTAKNKGLYRSAQVFDVFRAADNT